MKKLNVMLVCAFAVGRQLTGVRPPKDDAAYVVVSCTKGKINLSPAAADLLSVKEGDYVEVVTGDEGEDKKFAIAKTEKGQGGSKLGGNLDFAAANAYQALEGNTETNTFYGISKENTDETGKYFVLSFVKSEAKIVKTKKA